MDFGGSGDTREMEAAAIPVSRRGPRAGLRATASDDRLVAGVRAGDDVAFGWIYDRYAGSLLAFCQHMLGSREEAEDALQHVFVAAHRQLRCDHPPKQLKPWLYAVARNRCVSALRARRETVALDDVVEPAAGADVSHSVQQRQDVREILGDIATLPHEQREALILAEVGALSHDEIAVTLGVRKDKVKALVFQARQSLMGSREARETSCREIQEQLAVLRGGALRRTTIRRHVAGCPECAAFKGEVQRQRSVLAAALPVLPAAALKNTILGAAHAGAGGGAGVAAAGGISALAAGAGSSTAVTGGLAGLGSSALVTKVLAVAAIAGLTTGGGAVVVHQLQHPKASTAAAAPAAPVSARTAPTRPPLTSISASTPAATIASPSSASTAAPTNGHGAARSAAHRHDHGVAKAAGKVKAKAAGKVKAKAAGKVKAKAKGKAKLKAVGARPKALTHAKGAAAKKVKAPKSKAPKKIKAPKKVRVVGAAVSPSPAAVRKPKPAAPVKRAKPAPPKPAPAKPAPKGRGHGPGGSKHP
jgi:RNA polymerase sigma factor (sigma-70 family)